MFGRLFRWIAPELVLVAALAGGRYIISQRPAAQQFQPPAASRLDLILEDLRAFARRAFIGYTAARGAGQPARS